MYTYEPHDFKKIRSLAWLVCRGCGLVQLRNPFTQWAIRMGCNNEDHPDYARKRVELTRANDSDPI